MILEDFPKIRIVQIGCGGTGSYLFPQIKRFLYNIQRRLNQDNDEYYLEYCIVDDDFVEQRNILRQNFNESNIGRLKTKSLILNYPLMFQNIICINTRIKSKKTFWDIMDSHLSILEPENFLQIIIGCVDNNKTRRIIFREISQSEKNILYIDSGNNLFNGQIITSISEGLKGNQLFSHFENIKFLKTFKLKDDNETDESCAFFGDQSQSTNLMAGTLSFCCIQKLFIEKLLPPPIIRFNNSGWSNLEV